MDGRLTVSVKSIVIAGLTALGLVAAYLLGGAGQPQAASAAEDDGDDRRQVVMRGIGEATAVPDELSFTVGVGVVRPDVSAALDVASKSMTRVLAALAPFGIEEKDIATSGLSVEAVERYTKGVPQITGYRVEQSARITVRNLAGAGKAIAAAVSAGGNDTRVSGVMLAIGDPESVLDDAREEAVKAATAKAETYADATGQELGDVLSVEEVQPVSPEPFGGLYDRYAETSAAANLAVPIKAGEQELAVTVQVVWALG